VQPCPVPSKTPDSDETWRNRNLATRWQAGSKELLVDLARLEKEYFERRLDLHDPNHWSTLGLSGHRGSSLHGSFNEAHVLAITQAICDYRREHGTDGPLYMGKDTHALSGLHSALRSKFWRRTTWKRSFRKRDGVTPTPVNLAGHPGLQP